MNEITFVNKWRMNQQNHQLTDFFISFDTCLPLNVLMKCFYYFIPISLRVQYSGSNRARKKMRITAQIF